MRQRITLQDIQRMNAEFAAKKAAEAEAKAKAEGEAEEVQEEKPAKQPKKRKHLVVEESEWMEPIQEETNDEVAESQGE